MRKFFAARRDVRWEAGRWGPFVAQAQPPWSLRPANPFVQDRMDLFRRIELTTGAPSPAGQTGHRQISGRTSEGRRPRGASPMAGVPLQGASVETEAVPT